MIARVLSLLVASLVCVNCIDINAGGIININTAADASVTLPTGPIVASLLQSPNRTAVIADQYIVHLRDFEAATFTAIRTLLTSLTLTPIFTITDVIPAIVVKIPAVNMNAVLAAASVLYVEEDVAVFGSDIKVQDRPVWGLDRLDQRATSGDSKYAYNTTADNVYAYVIDTGIHITHSDFGSPSRATYGFTAFDDGVS